MKYKFKIWHAAIAIVLLLFIVKMGGLGYLGAITGLCKSSEPNNLQDMVSDISKWNMGTEPAIVTTQPHPADPNVDYTSISWGNLRADIVDTKAEANKGCFEVEVFYALFGYAFPNIDDKLYFATQYNNYGEMTSVLDRWFDITFDVNASGFEPLNIKIGMESLEAPDYFLMKDVKVIYANGTEEPLAGWTSTSTIETTDVIKLTYLSDSRVYAENIFDLGDLSQVRNVVVSYYVPKATSELPEGSHMYEKDKSIGYLNGTYFICNDANNILLLLNDESLKDAYLDQFIQCTECAAEDKETKTCDDGSVVNYQYCVDEKWQINETCPVAKPSGGGGGGGRVLTTAAITPASGSSAEKEIVTEYAWVFPIGLIIALIYAETRYKLTKKILSIFK